MQTNNILRSELLDIIFDGRNKDYGAYELRNNYSKRIRTAMLVTGLIAFIAIGGSVLANSTKRNLVVEDKNEGLLITEITEQKIDQPLPEPEPPQAEPEPEVRTEQFTNPEILPDELVQTPPPTQDELKNAEIDTEKKEGIDDPGISRPKDIDHGTEIIEVKRHEEPEGPLAVVDLDAKFNGNWKQFLEKNLVPEIPVSNDAPPGRYPVEVKFVVDLEGHVSDIVATTHHGYGMEEEAIRVIRKSAKWEPAVFNGRMVKAYKRQLITFVVEGE